MWRSMGVALLGLAVVACGDELAEGVDEGQQAPADAGAADATQAQAVDAAPRPCTSCDAGKVGDAAVSDAGRVVQISAVPSTCRANEISGTLLSSRCYSESELKGMGCVLGGMGDVNNHTVVATEAQFRETHWVLTYTTTAQSLTRGYLCTGAEPAAGWGCGTPLFSDSASRTTYALSLMRMVYATCAL
jgi:hypothetical protein